MNVILSRPNWRSLKRFNSELRRPTLGFLDTSIKICLLAIIIHGQNWAKWVESSTLSKYSHLDCSGQQKFIIMMSRSRTWTHEWLILTFPFHRMPENRHSKKTKTKRRKKKTLEKWTQGLFQIKFRYKSSLQWSWSR